MDNAEALSNWAMNRQKTPKGRNELGWDWFDPLHCWNDLYDYWVNGEVKANLMHRSRIQRQPKGESKVCRLPMAAESGAGEERLFPTLPCNSELRAKLNSGDGDGQGRRRKGVDW